MLLAPGVRRDVPETRNATSNAWGDVVRRQDGAKYTVGVGLRAFFTLSIADPCPVMAASTPITLPVVILFVRLQRNLATGMTAGAVKG